jgi:hypothetical protein
MDLQKCPPQLFLGSVKFIVYGNERGGELLSVQIKEGFKDGKDLVVTVMAAMGEEQICALKDVGPKN